MPSATKLKPLAPYIDHKSRTVTSSTKELKLDWGHSVLTINSPMAQGACGNLAAAGEVQLADLSISVPLDAAYTIVVSLDEQPLKTSKRMLIQLMTEEKGTGFRSEPTEGQRQRIASIGESPWLVKKLKGVIKFQRPDAASLKVTPLNSYGEPSSPSKKLSAAEMTLQPDNLYYLVSVE